MYDKTKYSHIVEIYNYQKIIKEGWLKKNGELIKNILIILENRSRNIY